MQKVASLGIKIQSGRHKSGQKNEAKSLQAESEINFLRFLHVILTFFQWVFKKRSSEHYMIYILVARRQNNCVMISSKQKQNNSLIETKFQIWKAQL